MSGKTYNDPISSDPVYSHPHIWVVDIWTQLSSAALNAFSAVYMAPTSRSRLLSANEDSTRYPGANPMARTYDGTAPALNGTAPLLAQPAPWRLVLQLGSLKWGLLH